MKITFLCIILDKFYKNLIREVLPQLREFQNRTFPDKQPPVFERIDLIRPSFKKRAAEHFLKLPVVDTGAPPQTQKHKIPRRFIEVQAVALARNRRIRRRIEVLRHIEGVRFSYPVRK